MKVSKILILLCLIVNYTTCYSQHPKMDKEVEELIALGKDSIIDLGLKYINAESEYRINGKASREDFSKIKVFTNGKDISVSFRNPIKYLPIKTVAMSDYGVFLLGGLISTSQISNPSGYNSYGNDKTIPDYKIPFYKETKEMKKNIQFVLNAINKSDEVGTIGDRSNFEDNMVIYEYENGYNIIVDSEYQVSSYTIEKISGKISNTEHEHKEIDPYPYKCENQFKEID